MRVNERVKISWTELANNVETSEGTISDDCDDEESEGTGNATEDENDQLDDENEQLDDELLTLDDECTEMAADEECNFDIEITEDQSSEVICATGNLLPNAPLQWTGFKGVFDNLDKNIRPSHQRSDRQTISLHYCHVMAVSDRIDFSSLSDVAPQNVVINPCSLLPTVAEVDALKQEFQVIISRCVHLSIV